MRSLFARPSVSWSETRRFNRQTIAQPGVGRAVPGGLYQSPPPGTDHRAPTPSLPDWRLALDVAAIAVGLLGLAALGALMVMFERPWP